MGGDQAPKRTPLEDHLARVADDQRKAFKSSQQERDRTKSRQERRAENRNDAKSSRRMWTLFKLYENRRAKGLKPRNELEQSFEKAIVDSKGQRNGARK